VLEPKCVVFADRIGRRETGGFLEGLYAERLFLRNLPATGWLAAFMMHPLIVAGELLRSLPRGSTLTQIAGRLAAWFTLSDYRLHHHLLAVAREMAERDLGEPAVIAKLPRPTAASTEGPRREKRAG
jgi:hypothetical protein